MSGEQGFTDNNSILGAMVGVAEIYRHHSILGANMSGEQRFADITLY